MSIDRHVWKKIIGASRRHSWFDVHKYDCTTHNGNLLDSLSPNGLVKGFQIISLEKDNRRISPLFVALRTYDSLAPFMVVYSEGDYYVKE